MSDGTTDAPFPFSLFELAAAETMLSINPRPLLTNSSYTGLFS